jgi:hypothetical protein
MHQIALLQEIQDASAWSFGHGGSNHVVKNGFPLGTGEMVQERNVDLVLIRRNAR